MDDQEPINEPPVDETLLERRLLRGMAKGDRSAFDLFVETYTPALLRYAHGHLSGHEQAVPDVVQSTLATAVERLDSFRGEGALGAWLISICRFKIGTYFRRRQVRDRWAPDGPVDLETVEDPEGSPMEALGRSRRRATVHSTLDLLTPPYGDILEWKYIEELSVKEIAGRLDVSPKAAESKLTRAREAFRKLFGATQEGRGMFG